MAHGIFIASHEVFRCGAWTLWLWCMRDLSSPTGIEPTTPELQAGFSTTGPPGKSHYAVLSRKFNTFDKNLSEHF